MSRVGRWVARIVSAIVAVVVGVLTFSWWRGTRKRKNELGDQAEKIGKLEGKLQANVVRDAGATEAAKVKEEFAKIEKEAADAKPADFVDSLNRLGGK